MNEKPKLKWNMFTFKGVAYKLYNNPLYIIQYFKKIYFLFFYDYNFLYEKYSSFNYLNIDETLNQVVVHRKSVARFGDGEIEMILGGSNYSGRYKEKYSKNLGLIIKKLLMNTKNEKLLICIPHRMLLKDFSNSFFWYFAQYNFYRFMSKEYFYGDLFLFRDANKKQLNTFINYLNSKDILYISNKKNISIFKKQFKFDSVKYLETPAHESFSKYDEIKSKSLTFINEHKNPIILISSGKTSKVLVYDLNHKAQIIDVGAMIEANKIVSK